MAMIMRSAGSPRDEARDLAFGSILHVNEKGGCFGGTEEYIALLTAELAGRGVRSHLACGVVTGDAPPALASIDVIEGLASRRPRSGTADELLGLVAELAPDVVYVHNVFDASVVSALAGLPDRGPLIWYVHDHYLTCLSELRWRRDVGSCPECLGPGCLAAIDADRCVLRYPDRRVGTVELDERRALSRSLGDVDAIVVVSDYMRSLLAAAEPAVAGRIHLTPRPIRDLGAMRWRGRQTPLDPALITFAGRITPEKGLDVLIEALGAVRGTGPIELRIAGVIEHDGHWARCRQLQATAMAANPQLSVTYVGHLDYQGIDELFRHSDVVAVPSQWPEPLGAVAIEAMSAGAAVVAANIGGLGTALVDGHNGSLVEPADVGAWSTAIESLLRHPARAQRLGAQAHRDVTGATIADHVRALDAIVRRA